VDILQVFLGKGPERIIIINLQRGEKLLENSNGFRNF